MKDIGKPKAKRQQHEIIFVERTVDKPIDPGVKELAERWLADLLFRDWLKKKGFKT